MEEKKMTYEQLEEVANQLSEQLKQAFTKLQEMNMVNIFKRLEFLFKVVEHKEVFSIEFVTKCVKEIEEILTIPEEEKKD